LPRKSKVASAAWWCPPSLNTTDAAIITRGDYQVLRNSFGNFAKLIAIRRADRR
jgi:hypothetical protein